MQREPRAAELRALPVARALAEALFPAGERTPRADPDEIVARVARWLRPHPALGRALGAGLWWLELRHLATRGRRFSRAGAAKRRAFLRALGPSLLGGSLLRALTAPFKAAYVLDEDRQREHGQRPRVEVPSRAESRRWLSRIGTPDDVDAEEGLEADVVVIGTGAGGAAAAYELATRGLAVLLLEEGAYYDRTHFTGELPEVIPKLYRAAGATTAVGNVFMPIPIGRNVGGTTTVNSGTAMRPPREVLESWRRERGLSELGEAELDPWLRGVEDVLCVERAEPRHVGPVGEVVGEGARRLGFERLGPLPRNARGCDGQGLCQFGCPTGAKQSTNVSYVPRALDAGAFLLTGVKAERVLHEEGRVRGVAARGRRSDGSAVRIRVRADRVVVSAGAFLTPRLLRESGVSSPHLGRHLTVHPAGVVNAWFPGRSFENSRTIPQGFGVYDLDEEGLVFEGGTIPFPGHGLLGNLYGEDYVRFTERYQETAYFGFMVRDTSEGRVRRGPHPDLPLVTYRMNRADFASFRRGAELLGRMFLAAGAKEVTLPGTRHTQVVRSEAELAHYVRSRRRPTDFMMTAYHPLGTARIARSPREGVCDAGHAVFGWRGLYVMDGSSVPTSLGANPQLTIMALASRAAARLGERIEARADAA